MIHIVEVIKLLLLPGNRLKHIHGNVRYLVTWNIKVFKKWMFVGACVCVCPGITLERLERFRPNLVHTLLYVCVIILCTFYIYSAGRMAWEAGNLDDSHC
jgi:hypothetical protein